MVLNIIPLLENRRETMVEKSPWQGFIGQGILASNRLVGRCSLLTGLHAQFYFCPHILTATQLGVSLQVYPGTSSPERDDVTRNPTLLIDYDFRRRIGTALS